ncbi:hypothetical protein LR48_Vigan377s000800 [Vigna angularis]|uniref:Putative plant transposon protein domain-containing protein n=1 Tax=Phaseolus angularis TaxID=3914 RepID=A0A0L9T8Z8_PHAAN|nr:hypothetical protein LR48_Vigan377s000800 [Vigna angularis]
MASSSRRRVKTTGNKRKEKEQYYSHQFRTAAHESLEGRSTPEAGGNLATYLAPASIPIVKEFYTNAKALRGEQETYTSYVRGEKISFNADTINTFLGID